MNKKQLNKILNILSKTKPFYSYGLCSLIKTTFNTDYVLQERFLNILDEYFELDRFSYSNLLVNCDDYKCEDTIEEKKRVENNTRLCEMRMTIIILVNEIYKDTYE